MILTQYPLTSLFKGLSAVLHALHKCVELSYQSWNLQQ